MSKIRRNDPCPCGSGKKYKRCCGRHGNNIDFNAVNNELYNVHNELISYVTNKMSDQLDKQIHQYEDPSLHEEETLEVYNTGLIPWIIAMIPFLENNETILNRFFNVIKRKLSPYSINIFRKWLSAKPSIYEVISIGTPKNHFLHIKDLYTNDTFYVPYENADDFMEGSLLVGVLIPFADHHNFLFTMVKLYQRKKAHYAQLLKEFYEAPESIEDSFPKLLVKALNDETLEDQWSDAVYEEVARLLTKQLMDKDFNDQVIMKGVAGWKEFCEITKPTIRKIEPYAAAMDYYVQRNIINDSDVTQQQVADEYSTTSSTLSTIYRRIVKAL